MSVARMLMPRARTAVLKKNASRACRVTRRRRLELVMLKSETWPDADLSDPALTVEVAVRLTDYIGALEPVLRQP